MMRLQFLAISVVLMYAYGSTDFFFVRTKMLDNRRRYNNLLAACIIIAPVSIEFVLVLFRFQYLACLVITVI